MNRGKLLLGIILTMFMTVGCMQDSTSEEDTSGEATTMRGERGTGAFSKDLPATMMADGTAIGTKCANARQEMIQKVLADNSLSREQQDEKIRQILALECRASSAAANASTQSTGDARPRLFFERSTAKGRSVYRFTYGYWPWHHIDTTSSTTISSTIGSYCRNIFGFTTDRCLGWLGWGYNWSDWYDFRDQYRSYCTFYSPYYYATDYTTYSYGYYNSLYDRWLGGCSRRVVYINGQYLYY